jgi:hypothetical protein
MLLPLLHPVKAIGQANRVASAVGVSCQGLLPELEGHAHITSDYKSKPTAAEYLAEILFIFPPDAFIL